MNNVLKNTRRIFNTSDSSLVTAISILSNNVYKVTYYEIISGASGTLTVPTGATINAGEFAGANCVLSEIDGSNKPTYVTPVDGGGAPVTSTLDVGTGAWVKSAVTVSTNVALIYSVNIAAIDYQNLNNFYVIETALIPGIEITTPDAILLSNNSNNLDYLVVPAGDSIRRNAGNTAYEAFTPGTGGGAASNLFNYYNFI